MKNKRLPFLVLFFAVALMLCAVCFSSQSPIVYAAGDSLPSVYCLYNIPSVYGENKEVETANLHINVGNQRSTNICWAFASNTALETTIYMKAQKDSDFVVSDYLNFSELDMAYTLFNKRGFNETKAGTFDLACEYLTSEYGPVNEKSAESSLFVLSSDQNAFNYYANHYNDREVSKYSVMDAVCYPSKQYILNTASSENWTEAKKKSQLDNLRLSIKQHIMTYGACISTIYSKTSLYDYSVTPCTYICTDAINQNHMITLVGWDDEYTYTKGTQKYTGAYIAQNSYGSETFGTDGFFYIMYDDYNVENGVCGFKDVSYTLRSSYSNVEKYNHTLGLDKENEFTTYSNQGGVEQFNMFYKYYSSTAYFANIYAVNNPSVSKIFRLKIPSIAVDGKADFSFKVYIIDNLDDTLAASNASSQLNSHFSTKTLVKDKNGNYTFSSRFTGYYSIDLGANAITLNGSYFAVVLEMDSGAIIFVDNAPDTGLSLDNTFYKGNVSWSKYQEDGVACYLPMEIQTSTDLVHIDYSLDRVVNTTYNGQDITLPSPVSDISYLNIEYYYDSQWSITPPAIRNAGDYTVGIRISKAGYTPAIDTISIHISPATLTITPYNAQSKTYGTIDDNITFSYSGRQYTDNISFRGLLGREEGEDVGQYLITLGSLTLNESLADNYVLSLVDKYYTISPQQLTIRIKDHTSYYGNLDYAYEYEIIHGFIKDGDDLGITYTCLDSDGNPVDNTTRSFSDGYTITATVSNGNYQTTIISGKLYIEYQQYTVLFVTASQTYSFYRYHFDLIGDVEVDVQFKGYIFRYWSLDAERIDDISSYQVTNDVTFVAIYDLIDINIVYELNGGYFSGGSIQSFNAESNCSLFEPSFYGYHFTGFHLKEDLSDDAFFALSENFNKYTIMPYVVESVVNETTLETIYSVTFYASFEANEYSVIVSTSSSAYSVNLPSNNIKYNETYNFSLTLSSAYNKSNPVIYVTYLASGLTRQLAVTQSDEPQADGSKMCYFTLRMLQDSNISFSVENIVINTYLVRFYRFSNMIYYHDSDLSVHKTNSDRTLISTSSPITHGNSLTNIPSLSAIDHYNQISPTWDRSNFSSITSDIDVYAIYTPNTYTVSFIGEDDVVYDIEYKYLDKLNIKKFEDLINLSFSSKVIYKDLDTSRPIAIENDMTIYYTIADYSWVALAGAGFVVFIIILYAIVSTAHYVSYPRKYSQ